MSENAGSGRNDSFGGGSDNPWDDRALDDQVGPGEAEPQADNTQWAESAAPASVTAVRRPLRPAGAGNTTKAGGQRPVSAAEPRRREDSPKSEKRRGRWLTMLRGRTAATGPGDDVALAKSIRRPLNEPKNIAFINEGGGTGKTTTAVLLGLLLASLRNGPIVAVDASPGCGDLGNRVPESKRPAGNVRSVVEGIGRIRTLDDLRAHMNRVAGGLDVLAADASTSAEAVFTSTDYVRLTEILREHYEVTITDCAAGMVSDVVEAVLDDADLVVIVSEGGDGVRSSTWTANRMMDRAEAKPKYKRLLDDAVVVVNSRHDRTKTNTAKIMDFYRNIVRAVVEVPFDQHLEGGDIIVLDKLSKNTRTQLLRFGDAVISSDGFNQ